MRAIISEQFKATDCDGLVRQTLGEAVGLAIDLQLLSADAGDTTKPPGLFVGSDAITPTAGGGDAAMDKDLENLFGARAAKSGGKNAVIVAATPQVAKLKRTVGPKFDYEIIASTSLAAATVGVVELSSLVSGFSSTAEFSATKVGTVHMEDSAPTQITGGTPSPAVPARSLFQIDAIGLRTNLWAAWGLRASGHGQWIQSVTR